MIYAQIFARTYRYLSASLLPAVIRNTTPHPLAKMASWRAAFAPFLRGAFQALQPNKITIVLQCKPHYAPGAIRNMATFERKKPHVNIGMYTDEVGEYSIGQIC